MTLLVTQGTVQLEYVDVGSEDLKVNIYINPISDYTIKHGKEDYIVLMPELDKEAKFGDAKIFRKTQAFTASSRQIIEVIDTETKIEIKIDSSQPTVIKSIKIPATID